LEEKEDLKEKLRKLEEKELEYISKLKHTVMLKQEEFESFKSKNMNSLLIRLKTNFFSVSKYGKFFTYLIYFKFIVLPIKEGFRNGMISFPLLSI